VHAATTALGSVALGLAVLERRIDAEAALAASLLDELFEIERWGSDPEAERRHDVLRRDVAAACRFLDAIHGPAEPSGPGDGAR
jgi:chaperone required for assembly of F1-ATPase